MTCSRDERRDRVSGATITDPVEPSIAELEWGSLTMRPVALGRAAIDMIVDLKKTINVMSRQFKAGPGAFLDDQAVAQRVLEHAERGTTDVVDDVWREPVANYRSTERFELEIRDVLRRVPTPFCPSAALPEAGSYLAREAAGTPIVAVRGDDGRVRAFRNACRHRGMQVATGTGCARAFSCTYHGWTYALDGELRHIPHEHGFPGIEKGEHGLVPVVVEERSGLIYVRQDAPVPGPSPWDGLGELIADDQELLACNEFDADVNWKIYLESFLEGYHIRPTHMETFYPFGYDNLALVESVGRNSRVTFPFRRIEKLANVAPAERRVQGLVTYAYHLFPNAVITVLSHHTNLVVLEPLAVDRTKLVLYRLTNRGGGVAAKENAQRDAEFVDDTGAVEDLAVVCAIQRAIDSGANDAFTFGRFEGAISHFHRCMREALAAV